MGFRRNQHDPLFPYLSYSSLRTRGRQRRRRTDQHRIPDDGCRLPRRSLVRSHWATTNPGNAKMFPMTTLPKIWTSVKGFSMAQVVCNLSFHNFNSDFLISPWATANFGSSFATRFDATQSSREINPTDTSKHVVKGELATSRGGTTTKTHTDYLGRR